MCRAPTGSLPPSNKPATNINKTIQRAEIFSSSLCVLKKKNCFALFENESEFVWCGIKGRGELYHHTQFTLWIKARHTSLPSLCFHWARKNKPKKKVELAMKAFVSCFLRYVCKLKILKMVPRNRKKKKLNNNDEVATANIVMWFLWKWE